MHFLLHQRSCRTFGDPTIQDVMLGFSGKDPLSIRRARWPYLSVGESFSYWEASFLSLFRKLLTTYMIDVYLDYFLIDVGNWLSLSSLGYVSEQFESFLTSLRVGQDYLPPNPGPLFSSRNLSGPIHVTPGLLKFFGISGPLRGGLPSLVRLWVGLGWSLAQEGLCHLFRHIIID